MIDKPCELRENMHTLFQSFAIQIHFNGGEDVTYEVESAYFIFPKRDVNLWMDGIQESARQKVDVDDV